MSSITNFVPDAAWGPGVPPGHSEYTWIPEVQEEKKEKILPVKGKRNILITSALPYVNNVPHLGNIIGCVLSGDVYSRFCEQRGYQKLYICGTDEYGTATETKAQAEGMTPQQICDKYHVIHKEVYDWFNIKFDYFGRTTTPKQTEIAQDIFHKCDANNFVVHDSVEQLYCEKCTRFLADRYVAGTCPLCKYTDAKGDQCDKCSQLLNAIELVDPKCITCLSTPIVRSSNHLFLDLPNLKTELTSFIQDRCKNWTDNSVGISNSWLQKDLVPRCITRDLKWGTPVPKEGYTDKVFYVWFDAPIGYISITANYTDDWEQWWKNPDVELVQFMGKDNVPFHTIIFPSTLIAANDNYTMLDKLSTTEYINYEGAKFSKTRGVGVFGNDAMDTGIPSEIWRYYLLFNRPEQNDTMFLWDDFASKANTDLPNNLGNLIQRALSFLKARFGGVLPALDVALLGDAEKALQEEVSALLETYVRHLDAQQLKDGLKTAMNISNAGNKYLQDMKPWMLIKENPTQCATVMHVVTQLIFLVTILLEPYMPSFSDKVFAQMNASLPAKVLEDVGAWTLGSTSKLFLAAGHTIGEPEPIFKKIEAATIEALRLRYQGKTDVVAASGADFTATIKVCNVQEVNNHPSNPKLYVLKVDAGEEQPRQIVCNWVDHYKPEDILNANLCILCNTKPAKFGGVLSQGMALTAITIKEQGPVPVPVRAPGVKVGTIVLPKEHKHAPVNIFDVKTKIGSLGLLMGKDGATMSNGQPLFAKEDQILVPDVAEGSRLC